MINKIFDCVKMKNEIQEKIYNEISPKTSKEYFEKLIKRTSNNPLWLALKKHNSSTEKTSVISFKS